MTERFKKLDRQVTASLIAIYACTISAIVAVWCAPVPWNCVAFTVLILAAWAAYVRGMRLLEERRREVR